MSMTFYQYISERKTLNLTQKESMADQFCTSSPAILRQRFIFAIDVLINKGTIHNLELYREPFEQIEFHGNKCSFSHKVEHCEDFALKTLKESVRLLIMNQADTATRRKVV